MVEGDLEAVLAGIAATGANVWGNAAPDNVVAPYIVYFKVIGRPDNTLDGVAGTERHRFQIDIYSTTYGEVKTIYGQLKTAMAGASFANLQIENQDFYESDTKLHRVRSDWSIFA
jgi:hypothetical protein